MPCFGFLEGLLGRTSVSAPRLEPPTDAWTALEDLSTLEPRAAKSSAQFLPPELVEEIIRFVPPVLQEARYKTAVVGPKGVDLSLQGKYTVTFEGDVFVGGKANVHFTVEDKKWIAEDGRSKFPIFDYKWVTEVIAISDEGVHLARGDEDSSYIIKQKVVCGRLLMSLDDNSVPTELLSSESEISKKPLKRCD